jgi:hypothetical protein
MKKLLLSVALSVLTLIATSQVDTTKMSNYEKYVLAREQAEANKVDTLVKSEESKPEYDDLYYTPEKKVTTIFDKLKKKKEPKPEGYNYGYNDGYEEGYEDAYDNYVNDPYYYSNRINRFHSPFTFSFYFGYPYSYYPYYYPYYDPWYYDPYPYYGWGYYGYNYWYTPYYYNNYWYGYKLLMV